MKKIYLAMMIIGALFLFNAPVKAQVHFNLNVNIGSQPVWGPVGYDYVDYYYFPDVEVYYSVPSHCYYYYDRGRWVSATYLPHRYRDFDVYRSYKVVVNERDPWRRHDYYRERYANCRGRHDQRIIRDSDDEKYYVIKDHPRHGDWKEMGKHDNGLHLGQKKHGKWDNGDYGDYGRGNGRGNRNDWSGNERNDGNGRGNGNGNGHGHGKH